MLHLSRHWNRRVAAAMVAGAVAAGGVACSSFTVNPNAISALFGANGVVMSNQQCQAPSGDNLIVTHEWLAGQATLLGANLNTIRAQNHIPQTDPLTNMGVNWTLRIDTTTGLGIASGDLRSVDTGIPEAFGSIKLTLSDLFPPHGTTHGSGIYLAQGLVTIKSPSDIVGTVIGFYSPSGNLPPFFPASPIGGSAQPATSAVTPSPSALYLVMGPMPAILSGGGSIPFANPTAIGPALAQGFPALAPRLAQYDSAPSLDLWAGVTVPSCSIVNH